MVPSPSAVTPTELPLAATRAAVAAHVTNLKQKSANLELENSFLKADNVSLKRELDYVKSEFAKLKKCYTHYRNEAKRLKHEINRAAARPSIGLDINPSGAFVCGPEINDYGSNLTDPNFAIFLSENSDDE